MSLLTPARPRGRLIGAAWGIALALTIPVAGAQAGSAPDDGLCDTISIEELDALGPLRFDPPEYSEAGLCLLETPSGSHILSLVISGFSFDMIRDGSPDAVEITVGERPAVIVDGSVHVGLDEGILSVILETTGTGDPVDLDPVQYAVAVAGIVVPALDAIAAQQSPAAGPQLRPPEVAGIEWDRDPDVVSIAQLTENDEQQAAIWQPLIDATGVDAAQIFLLSITVRDAESRESLGNYSAIQATGTDEATLRTGVITFMEAASGTDAVTTEDVTLGGKTVIKLSVGGELRGYLYIQGDIAHAVTMSEDVAARVLEALP